jgi:hypothetical protein
MPDFNPEKIFQGPNYKAFIYEGVAFLESNTIANFGSGAATFTAFFAPDPIRLLVDADAQKEFNFAYLKYRVEIGFQLSNQAVDPTNWFLQTEFTVDGQSDRLANLSKFDPSLKPLAFTPKRSIQIPSELSPLISVSAAHFDGGTLPTGNVTCFLALEPEIYFANVPPLQVTSYF